MVFVASETYRQRQQEFQAAPGAGGPPPHPLHDLRHSCLSPARPTRRAHPRPLGTRWAHHRIFHPPTLHPPLRRIRAAHGERYGRDTPRRALAAAPSNRMGTSRETFRPVFYASPRGFLTAHRHRSRSRVGCPAIPALVVLVERRLHAGDPQSIATPASMDRSDKLPTTAPMVALVAPCRIDLLPSSSSEQFSRTACSILATSSSTFSRNRRSACSTKPGSQAAERISLELSARRAENRAGPL